RNALMPDFWITAGRLPTRFLSCDGRLSWAPPRMRPSTSPRTPWCLLVNAYLTPPNGGLTGQRHRFQPMFMRVLTGLTGPAPPKEVPSALGNQPRMNTDARFNAKTQWRNPFLTGKSTFLPEIGPLM